MKKQRLMLLLIVKRLFKNPLFIVTICLIPVLVLGLRFTAGNGDSLLRVAIFTPSSDAESTEHQLADHLLHTSGTAITFYRADSEESLRLDVADGTAACGYIFPDHLSEKLKVMGSSPKPVVTAIRQKNEVRTKLIDELVYSGIYEFLSFDILSGFIAQKTGEDHSPELKQRFKSYQKGQAFFEFEYADGSKNATLQSENADYMLFPIRGMTAVLLLLAGMVGSLLWYADRKARLFARFSMREQRQAELITITVPVAFAGISSLLSIFLTGISSGILNELLLMLLLLFDVVAFCRFLCQLLPNTDQMLACIPVFTAGSLIVCPVFANLSSVLPVLSYLSWLTPVSWYLNAVHDGKGKLIMLALGLLFFGFSSLIRRIGLSASLD